MNPFLLEPLGVGSAPVLHIASGMCPHLVEGGTSDPVPEPETWVVKGPVNIVKSSGKNGEDDKEDTVSVAI